MCLAASLRERQSPFLILKALVLPAVGGAATAAAGMALWQVPVSPLERILLFPPILLLAYSIAISVLGLPTLRRLWKMIFGKPGSGHVRT
jgi:hypothetical protein